MWLYSLRLPMKLSAKFLTGLLLIAFGLASAVACAQTPQRLLIGYGDWFAAPYALSEQNGSVGGVIRDLADELGRRLSREARLVDVSRRRIDEALETGEINVLCLANPTWLASPGDLLWSQPVIHERDVFIALPTRKLSLRGFQDLRGLSVGTVLGYRYSAELERMFAERQAHRDDAANIINNLDRLSLGWIDTMVVAETPLRYQMDRDPALAQLSVSSFVDAQQDYSCAFSRQSGISQTEIDRVIDELMASGTMARIVSRYR